MGLRIAETDFDTMQTAGCLRNVPDILGLYNTVTLKKRITI